MAAGGGREPRNGGSRDCESEESVEDREMGGEREREEGEKLL